MIWNVFIIWKPGFTFLYVCVSVLAHSLVHTMFLKACKPVNVCVFVVFVYTHIWYEDALHWHVVDDRPGLTGDGHFPGRSGHTMRDGFCAAVTRHYETPHTAPHTTSPWRWSHLIHRWHSIPAVTTQAHFSALTSVAVWVLFKSNLSF